MICKFYSHQIRSAGPFGTGRISISSYPENDTAGQRTEACGPQAVRTVRIPAGRTQAVPPQECRASAEPQSRGHAKQKGPLPLQKPFQLPYTAAKPSHMPKRHMGPAVHVCRMPFCYAYPRLNIKGRKPKGSPSAAPPVFRPQRIFTAPLLSFPSFFSFFSFTQADYRRAAQSYRRPGLHAAF